MNTSSESTTFIKFLKITLFVLFLLVIIFGWKLFALERKINGISNGDYLLQNLTETGVSKFNPYDIQLQWQTGRQEEAKIISATIADGNVVGSLEMELANGEQIKFSTYKAVSENISNDVKGITITDILAQEISDRTIAGIKLKLKTITSEELADGSVVNNILASASISGDKIQTAVIETNHLRNSIITEIKLADDAVTTHKILNSTILTEDLADNSITNEKLVNGAVTLDKLADNAVDSSKIGDGTITNADLADGSITDAKVSDTAAIGWSKISKLGSSLADLSSRNSIDVNIADLGNYFTAADVEGALAELGAAKMTVVGEYLKLDASNSPVTGTLKVGTFGETDPANYKSNIFITTESLPSVGTTTQQAIGFNANFTLNKSYSSIQGARAYITIPTNLGTLTNSSATGNYFGILCETGTSVGTLQGISGSVDFRGTVATQLFGANFSAGVATGSTVSGDVIGVTNSMSVVGTGSAANLIGNKANMTFSGVVPNVYGYEAQIYAQAGASVTNAYGLYIHTYNGQWNGVTTARGIYSTIGNNKFDNDIATNSVLILKAKTAQSADIFSILNAGDTNLGGISPLGHHYTASGLGFGSGTDTPTEGLQIKRQNNDSAVRYESIGGIVNSVYIPTSGTAVTGPGTLSWLNPVAITVIDNLRSTRSFNLPGQSTNYLLGSGFGFNLPQNATIEGYLVEIKKSKSTTNGTIVDKAVTLWNSGATGANKADTTTDWPVTANETIVSYGGATDLWGTNLTPAQINASGFGAAIAATDSTRSGSIAAQVDFIRITIYYRILTSDVNFVQGNDLTDSGNFKLSRNSSLGTNDVFVVNSGTGVFSFLTPAMANDSFKIIGNSDILQLLVKGNATQNNDLQQWQDSSGAMLSAISASGKASLATLRILNSSTPPSGNCSNPGDLSWDDSYLYVCTAGGWKRSQLSGY